VLAHVVKLMATKDEVAGVRRELKADIVHVSEQVASIETRLRDMRHVELQPRVADQEEEVFGDARLTSAGESSRLQSSLESDRQRVGSSTSPLSEPQSHDRLPDDLSTFGPPGRSGGPFSCRRSEAARNRRMPALSPCPLAAPCLHSELRVS